MFVRCEWYGKHHQSMFHYKGYLYKNSYCEDTLVLQTPF